MIKKSEIKILIAGLALLMCGNAGAQEIPALAGVAGAQFLRLDTGARAAAMGGSTYCSVYDDAFTVFYNPAGLSGIGKFELGCQYNMWYEGIESESVVAAVKLKSGSVIGVAGTYLHMGDITGTDENKQATGNFTAFDTAGMVSYARKLGQAGKTADGLYAGLNLKLIYQAIEVETATGFAADLGMLFRAGGFSAGLALQNAGTKMKFIETAYALPINLRSGISYATTGENRLSLSAGISLVSFDGLVVSAGGEYVMKDLFSMRAGYTTGNGLMDGFTAGAGIKTGVIVLDYAWIPGMLGNAQRVSLNIRF